MEPRNRAHGCLPSETVWRQCHSGLLTKRTVRETESLYGESLLTQRAQPPLHADRRMTSGQRDRPTDQGHSAAPGSGGAPELAVHSTNFFARLKGNGSKKPILLAAHADVVGVEREKRTVTVRGT